MPKFSKVNKNTKIYNFKLCRYSLQSSVLLVFFETMEVAGGNPSNVHDSVASTTFYFGLDMILQRLFSDYKYWYLVSVKATGGLSVS